MKFKDLKHLGCYQIIEGFNKTFTSRYTVRVMELNENNPTYIYCYGIPKGSAWVHIDNLKELDEASTQNC